MDRAGVAGAGPVPARPHGARIPGRGGQEVRRRPGRQARRAARLLRLPIAVSAAAGVRHPARLRARQQPGTATADHRHADRAVPRPGLPDPRQHHHHPGLRHRPGHRHPRHPVGRSGDHPERPGRHERGLEHPPQAPTQLLAASGPRPRFPARAGHRRRRGHRPGPARQDPARDPGSASLRRLPGAHPASAARLVPDPDRDVGAVAAAAARRGVQHSRTAASATVSPRFTAPVGMVHRSLSGRRSSSTRPLSSRTTTEADALRLVGLGASGCCQ